MQCLVYKGTGIKNCKLKGNMRLFTSRSGKHINHETRIFVEIFGQNFISFLLANDEKQLARCTDYIVYAFGQVNIVRRVLCRLREGHSAQVCTRKVKYLKVMGNELKRFGYQV